jgi:hypothetical protein
MLSIIGRRPISATRDHVIEALPKGIDNICEASSRGASEKSDYWHRGLLRARRERPRSRRAAEHRDECAAFHSITSSARASSIGGTSRGICKTGIGMSGSVIPA